MAIRRKIILAEDLLDLATKAVNTILFAKIKIQPECQILEYIEKIRDEKQMVQKRIKKWEF